MHAEKISQPNLESRLRGHVDVLAGLIGERNSRRPSALVAARAYISRQIVDLGLEVIEHSYQMAGRRAVNLEVTLSGRAPARPYLIVGAHYDTAPTTPGADDNASAVAALLEIVSALRAQKLARTVRCVFYDCEEPPHFATTQIGSFQDAKMISERGDKVHGMICLESIGYFPRRVSFRVHRPRFVIWLDWLMGGRFVVIVSNFGSIGFGLPFVLRFMSSGFFRFVPAALPGITGIHALSDNRSYWAFGVRALMVTNTALFRNPNYHEPSDLPDTLDYPRLAKLTRMLTRVISRSCR